MTNMANMTAQLWYDFEALVNEAVQRECYRGVNLLLDYEEKLNEIEYLKRKTKCVKPLIYAAINGNLFILKLFHQHNYTIPQPERIGCECDKCQRDKFGQSKQRIATLQALSNPSWLSLTSEDPLVDSFKLCGLNRRYGEQDDSFGTVYDDLSISNEKVCTDLLDEIATEEEGRCLMRHKATNCEATNCEGEEALDLSFLDFAVDYEMKEVVSHPILQHFLLTRVFDEIPGWRSSGIAYKFLIVLLTALSFPITTLFNILLPFNYCSKLKNIATKPFVKFVSGASSFLIFLALLAALGAHYEAAGIRNGHEINVIETLVFVWLLGFCVGELRQVYQQGISDYLSSGWNWIDLGMDVLMMFAYIVWIILFYHTPTYHKELRHFADGMFAFGIILSFFRVLYLCQITSYLGLLQLCLNSMVQVIFQFAFISMVVVFAFSVSMVFLFMSSSNHDTAEEKYERLSVNKSSIYRALTENYNGLVPTVVTMIWTALGASGRSTMNDFSDGSLVHLWANAFYILYFAITIVVLLNMLIAMMNNAYEGVEANLESEHKYSRTQLWLEYISDEMTRPVPFNLIPTPHIIKHVFQYITGIFRSCNLQGKWERHLTNRKEARKDYKTLCRKLMERYLFKRFGFHTGDDIPTDCEGENANFIQKIESQLESWDSLEETESSCVGIDDNAEFTTLTEVDGDENGLTKWMVPCPSILEL